MSAKNGTKSSATARSGLAVEEATELLHEERFREALLELRRVLQGDPKNPYAYYFLGIASLRGR